MKRIRFQREALFRMDSKYAETQGRRGKPMYEIPDYKKIRVIIDTDAACEADDPFAIVHALLSPKLIVKGIVAEHFAAAGSVEKSMEEIRMILKLMDLNVPAYMGQKEPVNSNQEISQGVDFIIEEALKEDDKPLFLLCQGAITNLAMAIRKCPAVKDRMTVIWIGTHGTGDRNAAFREFNAGNDVQAANEVLQSGINLWLVPSDVYTTINVGISELELKVAPYGDIGKHLFENLVNYNLSEEAGWTQGESWSLGDSPAISLAINPGCGKYVEEPAPLVTDDTSSVFKVDNPVIRVYKNVDSRYVLEDFFSKLRLRYGARNA